jgi:hypothetical protein
MKVSRLQAAKRQLRTAITMWFHEADPVSTHTLACAAYQIIHELNAKNKGPKLLFDADFIKEEFRPEANRLMKRPFDFFKHAGVKKEESIEFNPAMTEGFLLFGLRGLEQMGVKANDIDATFNYWTMIHKPHFLTSEGRKMFIDYVPVENIEAIRKFSRREFFEAFMTAFKQRRS